MAINIMKFEKYGTLIGIVKSKEPIVHTDQEFLDLIMQVNHDADSQFMVIEKEALPEEFYNLSSGIAGQFHQKLSNYRMRMAVVGDFSSYEQKSKAFADYVKESNDIGDIIFLRNINQAISYFAD